MIKLLSTEDQTKLLTELNFEYLRLIDPRFFSINLTTGSPLTVNVAVDYFFPANELADTINLMLELGADTKYFSSLTGIKDSRKRSLAPYFKDNQEILKFLEVE